LKLLLINANTTEAISDLVRQRAAAFASPETSLHVVTGRFGGRYVASRATYAIAGHAALDAYAEHGGNADGVIVACFGDPALQALQEIAHQPVVGMAEASCIEAATHGPFAIVTGGARWKPMLEEFVATIGLAEHLRAVHTVAPTGGDIARDPAGSLQMLREACHACVDQYGARSVILGGVGLAGLAAQIQADVPVPVIDSLGAAIRRAEAQVRAHRARPVAARPIDASETTGLSAPLAALLSRPRT
jgi:Asp/Glu/hydantoin racemase